MAGLDKNSKKKKLRHAVDMSALVGSEPTFKPHRDPNGDQSRTFDMFDCEVFHGIWVDKKGIMTDFCLEQVAYVDGERRVVARFDCCHQEAHVHRLNPDGEEDSRKVLMAIETQGDVKVAYAVAEKLFYDGWEVNMIRWNRGL